MSKSDKYKSTLGNSKTESKSIKNSSKDKDNEYDLFRSKSKDEKKSSGSNHHRSSKDERDRDRDNKENNHRSKNRVNDDEDKDSKSKNKHNEDERRQHRSSNHRRDENDDDKQKRKSKDRESHKKRNESEEVDTRYKVNEDEPNDAYEEDFDDDFEAESEEEKPQPKSKPETTKKYSDDEKNANKSKDKSSSKSSKKYSDDDDDYADSRARQNRNRAKYDEDHDYSLRDKIVKANEMVKIPTELVEVYSSQIFFNHDSQDRQKRRSKDLFKNMIELDTKKFSLLDINPSHMRTMYSSHLRHEKIQTNDDTLEIEIQTDDIETVIRWTQYPPEDSKGYGTEEKKFDNSIESADDILQKFRLDINFIDLHLFLQKSSMVIEELLRQETSVSNKVALTENKSDLQFSQGFTRFATPKSVAKINKQATVSKCVFSSDDSNYIVCSMSTPHEFEEKSQNRNMTLLLVWNINDPVNPYRVLQCDAVSNCLCYFGFLVISGNTDGSIDLWDLREPYSLHSNNSKNKAANDNDVIRSATYTTAGVLLNENHMSEVKCITTLQNQNGESNEKFQAIKKLKVFMQIATLELECKLIIWTVVELKNEHLNVFETELGLLPGGKIKLVKSSEILLNRIIRSPFGKSSFHTQSMAISPNQSNHLFVSTNIGQIIHITRKGSSFSTSIMKSNYADSQLFVNNVAFHHELQDLLLAGYGNGEIRLYHINYTIPIKTWSLGCMGNKIKEIKWIESRYSCFAIVDENDVFYMWDLLSDDTQPVLVKQMNEFGGISFPFIKSIKSDKSEKESDSAIVPFGFFNKMSRDLEIHAFAADWTRRSDKEMKKFAKLIKTYLISF